jgi:dTMP kinase
LGARANSLFITFEGGEGAGKSTQVRLLAERLKAKGRDVVTTREPGGTPAAETLRALLVTGDTTTWSAEAEALLNYAARDNHLRHFIRPALTRGAIVISDRFMDSTRAYQGYAGGCSFALIDALEIAIVAADRPRLTFILDLDPEAGLMRAATRSQGTEDRFERKGLPFHSLLRDGFRSIAALDPRRCRLISADQLVPEVAELIWAEIEPLLDG